MTLDLSTNHTSAGAKYWTAEVNQLYHPTGTLGQDKWDEVYSKGVLNTTKFDPILLKEWIYLLKKGGQLTVDYRANNVDEVRKVERNLWWLWKDKCEVTAHYPLTSKSHMGDWTEFTSPGWVRLMCKKKVSTKVTGDDITRWTFGIITNGKKVENVEKIIKSIREQKIPEYEIIICGTYNQPIANDTRYIQFADRDKEGWITRKKNLIVQNARHENLCIVHDRIVFNNDWYRAMKKWGNTFEILGCRQEYQGIRLIDWVVPHLVVSKEGFDDYYSISYMDYRDWAKTTMLMGQYYVIKRSLFTNGGQWFDETRYWIEKEDYELSKQLNAAGFIHRINPNSIVQSLGYNYLKHTEIRYDPHGTRPVMKVDSWRAWMKYINYWIAFCVSPDWWEKTRARVYGSIFK